MFDLQRYICFLTIRTPSLPLFQQIVPQLLAHQVSLLVGYPGDFWVLHRLGVEFDEFETDGSKGTEPSESPDPGEHVGYPTL